MLVRGTTIDWIGAAADAPAADRTIDLGGALVTPAFVDAHVHTTDTGIGLLGLDLAGTRSAAEVLDRLSAHAATLPADAIVVGHGWDESTWVEQRPPSAPELDRAGGGRSVYLSQVSVHSAVVSTALLDQTPPATPGYDEIGLAPARRAPRRPRHRHGLDLPVAARRAPSARHCGGRRHSASRPCTSAAARAPPTTTTSPSVLALAARRLVARGVRLLGRARWAPRRPGNSARSGPAATSTPTARSARRRRTCASRTWTAAIRGTAATGTSPPSRSPRTWSTAPASGMQGGFHAIGDAAIGTVLAGLPDRAAARRRRPAARRPAPHRARRDRGQAADRRVRRVRHRREHAARVRPALGRRARRCTRSVSASPGRSRATRSARWPASGWRSRSARTPRSRRWTRGARSAPRCRTTTRSADRRAGRVRRPHPGRLAGRAPRRRGRPRPRRPGHVRRLVRHARSRWWRRGRRTRLPHRSRPSRGTPPGAAECLRTVVRGSTIFNVEEPS